MTRKGSPDEEKVQKKKVPRFSVNWISPDRNVNDFAGQKFLTKKKKVGTAPA